VWRGLDGALDGSPVDELAYPPRRSEEQIEVLGDSSIAVTGDDHGHAQSGVAREAAAIPAATSAGRGWLDVVEAPQESLQVPVRSLRTRPLACAPAVGLAALEPVDRPASPEIQGVETPTAC
jgi:hypothetical protein